MKAFQFTRCGGLRAECLSARKWIRHKPSCLRIRRHGFYNFDQTVSNLGSDYDGRHRQLVSVEIASYNDMLNRQSSLTSGVCLSSCYGNSHYCVFPWLCRDCMSKTSGRRESSMEISTVFTDQWNHSNLLLQALCHNAGQDIFATLQRPKCGSCRMFFGAWTRFCRYVVIVYFVCTP